MLFAHRNGLAQPLGGSTESELIQDMACQIGPRVDGVVASRSMPQAMGAFSTAGAANACAGRDQQQEQHTPTTMRGLGQPAAGGMAPDGAPPPPTAPSGQQKLRMQMQRMVFAPGMAVMAPDSSAPPPDTGTPTPPAVVPGPPAALPNMPGMLTPAGYPPGTITAFSSKTSVWRIAVPSAAATPVGFGIFSAATAFTEVASQPAPPAGATQVAEKDLEAKTGQLPFYKKPLFWVAVAGGVVVIGGGGYFLLRRRKAAVPAAFAF